MIQGHTRDSTFGWMLKTQVTDSAQQLGFQQEVPIKRAHVSYIFVVQV